MWKYIFLLIVIAIYLVNLVKNRKFYKLSKTLRHDIISLPFLGVAYIFVGGGQAIVRGLETIGRETLKQKGILSAWFAGRYFIVIADPILADHVAKTCLNKDDILLKCLRMILGNCNLIAPESTLGAKIDAQNKPQHPFILALEKGTQLLGERLVQPWLHYDFLYQLLPQHKSLMQVKDYFDEFIEKIIRAQRKNIPEEEYKNKPQTIDKSLLELLIENSNNFGGYSDVELREETLGLAVAAIDTTAIASGFVCHVLATHPEVQEKVYAELADVFDDHENITPEHLPRLKYLNIVIKETLRLYPPVPVVLRKVDSPCKLPSGVTLPQGCGIVLHLWAINRNPEYWGTDAELFRPERFLEGSLKHPAQFVTFGIAPKNCIGSKYSMMSMLTTFATLLRQYRILPARSASDAGAGAAPGTDGLRLTFGITVKDVNHFPVVLQLRNLKKT